jgi:hypothetical protein
MIRWYVVTTFPHYQPNDPIITYTQDLMGLKVGINVVYLEENKPSYLLVRSATAEEVYYNHIAMKQSVFQVDQEGNIYVGLS